MIWEIVFNSDCYGDNIVLEENEEYRKNNDELYGICEKLCKDMPEEEKRDILNKIFFAQCGAECVASEEYFKEGFKLGLILGAQNFLE